MKIIMISGLIHLLQQPGFVFDTEEYCQNRLDFLTDNLPRLAAAESHYEADDPYNTWLDDLNKVAYDADDIADDFRYANLQAEAEAEGCQNQNVDNVRAGLFSCFKNSSINRPCLNKGANEALPQIRKRIHRVLRRIQYLVQRMTDLNFGPGQEMNITTTKRPQQLIFSSSIEIVGRDKEKEDIVKHILKSEGQFNIFIVGPHGIGKTALARLVCNDARIKDLDCVIWVEVEPESSVAKVTKSIIDQVIGKDCCISIYDKYLLKLRFYQELMGKKYILVLDGMSGIDHMWDSFGQFLESANELSQALIVTQDVCRHDVMGGCGYTCELPPLMAEDGWNIFWKNALSDDAIKTRPEILKEMGNKIIIICGGSPLALNMMGGLMRFKKEPQEWRRVINRLEKEVLNDIGGDEATIETIIKVCYDNLCFQVKQCFAFCSLFPEGSYMDKEVLIKLWMANGLLLPSDGSGSRPPEEEGNIVFNELASRHFFEDIKSVHEDHLYGNKHGYHSRVTCKMMHLIHEQAVIAARELALGFPYLQSIPGEPSKKKNIPSDPQVDIPKLLRTNPTMRILLSPYDPFITTVNCSEVSEANSLRGLHLHSALFQPDLLELKYMRHLRYLDLSASRIKILPESTTLLYLLETLNLSKCLDLYQLPENMKHMKSLRHLYIHKCPKLRKMPAHFIQLTNLQTLTTYIVGEKNANTGIDQIKDLHLSGLLELYNLHKVKTVANAKEADLISKTNLDRLTLCWGSEQLVMSKGKNDLGVLEALQPHSQLKVLKVQQYGGREFATWLANPVATGLINLVEVHLIGCSQCETLPAVWKLSSLRVLCLKHMASLTCISCAHENDTSKLYFPSLKRLVLVGLKKLERWHEGEKVIHTIIGGGGATCSNLKTTSEEVTFTVLHQLEITSCPNLKTMPRAPQLKHITASIENYGLLQSVTDLITQPESLVEEANIAKASDADNEPFPALGSEVAGRVNNKLRTMRMDSTNSVFMPIALPHLLMGLWRPFEELRYLEIFNCNTLVLWPFEFIYLKSLIRLTIRMCPNLTGIPARAKDYNMPIFPNLIKLEFYGCSSLKQVPIGNEFLEFLELDECPEVESVGGIERLTMLYLSCTSWTSLPSWFERITRLNTLWISECYSLTSLPDMSQIRKFEILVINECPMLKELPETFNPPEYFHISKCPGLEKLCKTEPYSTMISIF